MRLSSGKLFAAAVSAALMIGLGACKRTSAEDEARLRDTSDGADWAAPGRTFGEQHFSPLTQIDAGNAAQLGLAWSLDLPPGASVSQPLAVGGIVYVATGQAVVRAIDAVSGKQLWVYDPQVWTKAGKRMRFAWGTRGLAWYGGKLFVGTMDGRLIAIDAKTGKEVWSVQTLKDGDLTQITGAPRAFDGKVIIGFGGADFGAVRGYVSTYDAETGKLLWRWYTVPGDPAKDFEDKSQEMAAKTWAGEWWKLGGGGTAWNAFSYDPETSTVFVGVGNGSPWNHKVRSQGKGDNLFLASIVALDAGSGAYKWHYQVNPGETWDFGATMDMAFADLEVGGKARKVLMTMPKNGFFYVIDRLDGKLISAEPVVRVNWASKIDLATGRPVENPAARYPDGANFAAFPSGNGGHNWYPMAYSPKTRLVYIPVLERAMNWQDYGVAGDEWKKVSPLGTIQAATMNGLPEVPGERLNKTGRLEAWDPVAQKRVWSQPVSGTEGGSVMATAGNLVFQGQFDGSFNAYAADSGKRVWTFQANAPVLAPPISYTAGGKQYVTVLSGNSGHAALFGADHARWGIDYRTMARRVLTFAIGGKATLPPRVKPDPRMMDDPQFKRDPVREGRGAMTYGLYCSTCHGFFAYPAGAGPDLRKSAVVPSAEGFVRVVHDGVLESAGMPKFDDLDASAREDVRQYIRAQAAAAR